MYLITRPLAKLANTASAFAGAGLSATVVALQNTVEIADGLTTLKTRLISYPDAIVIVTSTAAALPLANLVRHTSEHQKFIAVGQSSAQLLTQAGLFPVIPENENSEGVLALPLLSDCANKHILLLKGESGRQVIPEQLTLRGASLEEIVLYRRERLTPPVFSRECNWTQLNGVIVTSSEQALALLTEFNTQPLTGLKWLTVSERIAKQLQEHGIRQTFVCPKASNEALITWIQQNWE